MTFTSTPQHDTLILIPYEEDEMRGRPRQLPSGIWQVRVWWQGERREITHNKKGELLETEKQMQKAWVAISQEIEDKVFDPQEWMRNRPFLLHHAFETFQKAKQCGQEWKYAREKYFKNHVASLQDMDIREIRALHLNELHGRLIEKGLSPKTIKNVMGLLSSVWHFHRIPPPGFPKVDVPDAEIPWLTREQQEHIMTHLDEQDQPIFRFLQLTGCRPSEACALQREDLRSNGVIIKRSMGHRRRVIPYTKNRRVREIPMFVFAEYPGLFKPREATPFVFSRNGRPYHRQRLQRAWRRALGAAGTPYIHVKNAFRHSKASQDLNDGVPLPIVSKRLGHSSVKMTERVYGMLTPETIWREKSKVVGIGYGNELGTKGK